MDQPTAKRRLLELESLTQTYGGIVVVKLMQKRDMPNYRTYIGTGKIEEIVELAKKEGAELLIVNNLLKPKQMFELGEILRKNNMHVWDRVDLILKIFDKHAKTAEAKLQIKLAAIRHMGPRIFGMGMELMQQGGGIGTRGQGETNTEIMKRHLASQEEQVQKQLDKLAVSRAGHRHRRDRIGLKTISIVGYTNAGKSSLLNALTKKHAYVANQLFATLDTRIGELWLPQLQKSVLLSDTIGFIQDLPPQLISAFRSTLDETVDADLLLHVIDVNDPYLPQKIEEVEEILKNLEVSRIPKIYVFNKIDLKKRVPRTTLMKKYKEFHPVFVSSITKEGLEELKEEIEGMI
jgi:GTP-binding protein HflX